MGRVNSVLAANIRQKRIDFGIGQQELADRLTAITGDNITRLMVSDWERDKKLIPAEIAHHISTALGCSSFELYPYSSVVPDQELRLMSRIRALPKDEKDDLDYLLNTWDGDTRALLKLDVIHAVLPERRRYDSDLAIIEAYKEAVRVGDSDVDGRVKTDLPYILRVWRRLDK